MGEMKSGGAKEEEISEGRRGSAEVLQGHLKRVTLADVFDESAGGFSFILGWQFITLFSPAIHFSTYNDISHFNSVLGFISVGMLLVLLAAALVPRHFMRKSVAKVLRHFAPCVVALCTGALVVVDVVGPDYGQPWCSIASTLAGAGLGVFYLSWGELFSHLNIIQVAAKIASSFSIAAVLFAIAVTLPRPATVTIAVTLPLLSGYLASRKLRPGDADAKEPSEPLQLKPFIMNAVLSLGALALTGSFVRALLLNATPIIGEGSYPWLLLVATLGSIVVVIVPLLSEESLDFVSAFKAAVFCLGLIFLLLPVIEFGSIAADILGLATYVVTMILVWVVLARVTKLYQLPASVMFGIGWASYTAGMLAGTFGGALLSSFFEITPRVLSIVTLVSVCLLFVVYLFVFTEKAMGRLLGGPTSESRRPFRERCLGIAASYGLTERETEIMMLVAKGRSTPRIREELGLTIGTTNTHMNHLYKKLDVHDRQELIDLVEGDLPGKES